MNDNTQLAVVDSEQHLPARNEGLQPVELENIAALQNAEPAPFDLMSDYWSPVNAGESRRVLFDRIQTMATVDQTSGEIIDLECAFFFYQEQPGGLTKQIRNGSKRLVGALQAFNLQRLTPLLIKYMGKTRNKTNANLSDNWSITPLRVDVTK